MAITFYPVLSTLVFNHVFNGIHNLKHILRQRNYASYLLFVHQSPRLPPQMLLSNLTAHLIGHPANRL